MAEMISDDLTLKEALCAMIDGEELEADHGSGKYLVYYNPDKGKFYTRSNGTVVSDAGMIYSFSDVTFRRKPKDSLIVEGDPIYNTCQRILFVLGGVTNTSDLLVKDFVGLMEKVIYLARRK